MLLTDAPKHSDRGRFEYGFGYFLPHKNALVPDLTREFGHVRCFEAASPPGMLKQVTRIARHLRAWQADILHCHLPLAGVVGRLAAAAARVPVVYTEHNVIERYHPATRLAAKATWRLQREVIAVSGEVAASIERHLGQSVRTTVVLNGVSLERFRREADDGVQAKRRLGLSPTTKVVGTVAVFRKQKRLDLWVEVAAALARSLPDVRFLLVGDGPLRGEIERRVRELGLVERCIFPGLQEDVRPYLAAMDVYLMTSDFEGVPIALLEAMAMELAPVTTDAGGIPEVIVSSAHGRLLPRGDLPALVSAVSELLTDDQTRQALAAAARRRIGAQFSSARMMQEIEKVYLDAARR